VNILNKQLQVSLPAWGLSRVLTTPNRKKFHVTRGLGLERVSVKRFELRKIDLRFVTSVYQESL
jgi:hypothetical protein